MEPYFHLTATNPFCLSSSLTPNLSIASLIAVACINEPKQFGALADQGNAPAALSLELRRHAYYTGEQGHVFRSSLEVPRYKMIIF